jgi:3-isopropylmalate/(R)-2-methylmalate dehydratase large subunit
MPLECKVKISGSLQKGVMPRDIGDYISGDVGPTGFRSMSVEVAGPTIDAMNLDERHALLNVLRGGAACSIMNPDQKVIDHITPIAKGPWEIITSDPDAEYEKILNYDVSKLEPQVVSGPARAQGAAKSVTESEGIEINEACIGSCGSGMMPDLRAAVEILKGKKVHKDVRLFITPSTQRIFMQAAREGLIETLLQAGAIILTPGCGTCVGYVGQLDSGEVAITTHNSNHTGRMGAMDATIHLGSTYTVAASAVKGKITDPRNLL